MFTLLFKKSSFSLFAAIVLVGFACASENQKSKKFDSYRNVPYVEITPVNVRNTLDIHLPYDAKKSPVMVYIHGGSWARGKKSLSEAHKLPFLIQQGFVVVSINYRLSSNTVTHPDHIQDVAKAVAWVKKHISYYDGDPDAIYLMGHSAGAHLASLLVLDEERAGEVGLSRTDFKGVVIVDTSSLNLVERMRSVNFALASDHVKAFGTQESTWEDASPFHKIQFDRQYAPFLFLIAAPVSMPNLELLDAQQKRKWKKIRQFSNKLKAGGTEVYHINAMHHTSHKTINDNLGKADDPPTAILADFLMLLESRRLNLPETIELPDTTTTSISGEPFAEALEAMGKYSASVLMGRRDKNKDGRIYEQELNEREAAVYLQWDQDSDKSLTSEEIVAGYLMLQSRSEEVNDE